jgi:hypothetical protein
MTGATDGLSYFGVAGGSLIANALFGIEAP